LFFTLLHCNQAFPQNIFLNELDVQSLLTFALCFL